jgi:virginiamycin B lyase
LPRISLAHAETGTATVTFMDPDRNAIPSTSTSTFVNPVTLSVVDPSNTVSISPTTPITNAAQVVTVTYTGGVTIGPSVTFNATAGGPSIGTLVSKTSGYQTTYALGGNKHPNEIDAGSDGALWFSEAGNVSIGRMDPANPTGFTEFLVPNSGSSPQPVALAAGPSGDPHIWFTQPTDISGSLGNFGNVPVPSGSPASTFFTGVAGSGPYGIRAVGGNMWIALQNSNKMLVASTTGSLVSPAPALPSGGTGPNGIAAGPDGNVWVTGFFNGTILSYSPTSPFNLLSQTLVPSGSGARPAEIVTGPDNALWFTEQIAGKIGRLLPGSPPIVEFSLPAPYGTPYAIAAGLDGGIWFTASGGGQSAIVRIDPTTHAFVAYPIASSTTQSSVGLVAGPDGNLWMTDYVASSIVKIQP